ncbi:Two-component response regulator SSK1p [Elasticomyces elasticus]|nr:Two-component response regulator SSK1p [Elasticomyces elasticus]
MARFLNLARPSTFFRRKKSEKSGDTNTQASTSTPRTSSHYTDGPAALPPADSRQTSLLSLHSTPQPHTRKSSTEQNNLVSPLEEGKRVQESGILLPPEEIDNSRRSGSETLALGRSPAGESVLSQEEDGGKGGSVLELKLDNCRQEHSDYECPPAVVVQQATPSGLGEAELAEEEAGGVSPISQHHRHFPGDNTRHYTGSAPVSPLSPYPVAPAHATPRIVQTTLHHAPSHSVDSTLPNSANLLDYFTPGLPNLTTMMSGTRKIWVRRPGASATLVQIKEDDLVDDVRDNILKKYRNSLGGIFDAPDMTLRIMTRAQQGQVQHERTLGPEEEMCRTLDSVFPGGQMVEEALIIDVPVRERDRRSPRPSPGFRAYGPAPASQQQQHQTQYQGLEDYRPLENGTDYFPPMPLPPASQLLQQAQAPMLQSSNSHDSRVSAHAHGANAVPVALEHHQRSISVINTGQLPPLPSPGGTLRPQRQHREHPRPRFQRQQTSSPTIVQHPSGYAQQQQQVSGMGALPPASVILQHPTHRGSIRGRTDSLDHSSGANGSVAGGLAVPAAGVPGQQPLPTPPITDSGVSASGSAPGGLAMVAGGSTPPTPNGSANGSGGLRPSKPKRTRKSTPDKAGSASGSRPPRRPREGADGKASGANGGAGGTSTPSMALSSVLDGSVPPINVLIVEDNIINLRILEGLMKRLRVRWQTAMNGQIAVDKWRKGGYHLVLMDIQMPVMNGLQATREIRRLERAGGIGVFSDLDDEVGKNVKKMGDVEKPDVDGEQNGGKKAGDVVAVRDDTLPLETGLFKSPVIIVALTASSLQSDRHEALAAGCNDFLTKPVNFVWLERKVKEWGCMQALIDFEGWRAWKVLVREEEEGKTDEQREAERVKAEKEKRRMEKMAVLQEKQRVKKEEEEREKEKERARKRASVQSSEVGGSTANGVASEA